MKTILSFIKSHPIVTFVAIAYLLSWWSAPFTDGRIIPYGPALAALIVLAITAGRSGLSNLWRRMTHWRVAWYCYVIGPGIIASYQSVAFALNMLLGATVTNYPRPPAMGTIITLLLLGGLWELATVRLLSTLALSIAAGFITQWVIQRGWLGENILRTQQPPKVLKSRDLLKAGWHFLREEWGKLLRPNPAPLYLATETACCNRMSISTASAAGPQGAGLLQIAAPPAQPASSAPLAGPTIPLNTFWSRLPCSGCPSTPAT